jgi:hypothetical protein
MAAAVVFPGKLAAGGGGGGAVRAGRHLKSSIHSGSSFLAEMARTTSSLRPLGKDSDSIMVLKPYL